MTFPSASSPVQPTPAHERVLLGFSLRLHLLYRGLLRASLRPGEETAYWTACAAEAINDLHHEFVVLTRARLERSFAAMHGREMRRWEEHLADIIFRSDTEDACSPDLLDEMKGLVDGGEQLLPFLENGTAKEVALMLSRYRRALVRLDASQPVAGARIFFLRREEELRPHDWGRLLTAILCEQSGDFAPVKRGSWRCLETALSEVAETLPLVPTRHQITELDVTPGRHPGILRFSLASRDRNPVN